MVDDARQYHVESTSKKTAAVGDVSLTADPEKRLTRRIVRPLLVENDVDPESPVKICLMHQRRSAVGEPWQDADSFSLATLKAGQEVRLELDSAQTRKLYEVLSDLLALSTDGVPMGRKDLLVIDVKGSPVYQGQATQIIRHLLSERDEEFWHLIDELDPESLKDVAFEKIKDLRRRAFQEFDTQLKARVWSEADWQAFFEQNTWIFGFGLAYQFLSSIETKPTYGGTTVSGTGSQAGDFLLATNADVRFTVLVEIKKPDSQLLGNRLYRSKAFALGQDLTGGVSQLQTNCRTWVREGSEQEENRASLESRSIYSYEPKGILVIGHTEQIASDVNKRATFQLFRRNLHNPEVITYDELLARARYVVSTAEL